MSTWTHTEWNETYKDGSVEGGYVLNLGCVHGTVHVMKDAQLTNRGYIERIVAQGGAYLVMQGRAESIEAESPADVLLSWGDLQRPMEPGEESRLPYTGPEGWGALDDAWARCVYGIDEVIETAHLERWAAKRAQYDPGRELAFEVARAAVSVTTMDDPRLWALISATIFNRTEDLRVANPDDLGMWCPNECRRTLQASLKDHKAVFMRAPELFSALGAVPERQRAVCAKQLYDVLLGVVSTLIAGIGDPPSKGAELAFAYYKSLLVDAVAHSLDDTGAQTPRRPRTKRDASIQPPADVAAAAASKRRAGAYPFEPQTDPVDAALRELDGLTGLETVKREVRMLAGQASVFADRERRGLKTMPITRHMVMLGNPGTGKNTVAELLGRIYAGYGVLRHGRTTYALRQDLVGKYMGTTAKETTEVFTKALGGVLFIDEAYSLAQSKEGRDEFGMEAINTLVPLMENHRTDIMVIAAGYPKPMREFLAANEGLKGRFGQTIVFLDYTDDELMVILESFLEASQYHLSRQARPVCRNAFAELRTLLDTDFANARTARVLAEGSVKRQAYRLSKMGRRRLSNAQASEIRPEDVPPAKELEPDRARADGDGAARAHDAA